MVNINKLIIMLFLTIALVLASCDNAAPLENNNIPEELKCANNEDCAPAACCHADSCINKNFKPDCKRAFCTLECRPGTMDCGKGYCACENNKCIAVIE